MYADYIEINRLNVEAAPLIYKKRQSIVEHPYGTIKRQWGFDHIITKKGLKRASADIGFIFIAYNLRRLINIIDKNSFYKVPAGACSFMCCHKGISKQFYHPIKLLIFYGTKYLSFLLSPQNRLKMDYFFQ